MPVLEQFHPKPKSLLVLWKIKESIAYLVENTRLTPSEQVRLNKIGSEKRKKEFLISRLLVQQFAGPQAQIVYNADGKPSLANSDLHISISHTKNIVGILLAEQPEIALDIEHLSERVEKVAGRFLSDEELKHISQEKRTVHLYQHWCAKECLIKLLGKKDLHLTRELKIAPFHPDDPEFKGQILRGTTPREYLFHHRQFEEYLLVWCC